MFHVVQTQTVNKDCLCLNDNPVPGTFSVSVFGAGLGGGVPSHLQIIPYSTGIILLLKSSHISLAIQECTISLQQC